MGAGGGAEGFVDEADSFSERLWPSSFGQFGIWNG